MSLRSINFLIGILILLFVLTTMGFAETAYANVCAVIFDQEIPEYARDIDYEYSQSDAEFIPSSSSRFMEGQSRADFESYDEFSRPEGSQFEPNNTF